MSTVIRNADWIVAFDRVSNSHIYTSGDVAFHGDRLVQVGGTYSGAVEREVS